MKQLFLLFICAVVAFAQLQKAKVYTPEHNVTGWLMSEKLDGIRAFWDGKHLLTRQNNQLTPPKEFLANFPPFALDGELWTKRNDFENIQSIVMKENSQDWKNITYNIFDVPYANGDFEQRLQSAKQWFRHNKNKNIKFVKQIPIKNEQHLEKFFKEIIKNSGEGMMIKNPHTPYESGRSANLLKYKPFADSEGKITEVIINPSTGKLKSLVLELEDGTTFKLGSGFSAKVRSNPPRIGEIVTFKYTGLTKNNKPKAASFVRVRKD